MSESTSNEGSATTDGNALPNRDPPDVTTRLKSAPDVTTRLKSAKGATRCKRGETRLHR